MIHADRHGAVVIPLELAADLPRCIELSIVNERPLLEAAKKIRILDCDPGTGISRFSEHTLSPLGGEPKILNDLPVFGSVARESGY